MSWRPLSLNHELGDLLDKGFLATAGSHWLVGELSRPSRANLSGALMLRGQLGFSYIDTWAAPYSTVASVCLRFSLIADRAVVVHGLTRHRLGDPRISDAAGRTWSLRDAIASLPPAPDRRAIAVGRVDEVKQTYGRMLGDIAYRIENAALFDPAAPTTRQFDAAMAMWADVSERTDLDEVVRRAGMVQLTFEAARAHAETIGLAHLPAQARDDARRAAKASRLAASSTSQAERDAALDTAVRILGSLALYYLPDPSDLPKAITRVKAR